MGAGTSDWRMNEGAVARVHARLSMGAGTSDWSTNEGAVAHASARAAVYALSLIHI